MKKTRKTAKARNARAARARERTRFQGAPIVAVRDALFSSVAPLLNFGQRGRAIGAARRAISR